jgi:hypothetical protein
MLRGLPADASSDVVPLFFQKWSATRERPFFVNTATGGTTWRLPTGARAVTFGPPPPLRSEAAPPREAAPLFFSFKDAAPEHASDGPALQSAAASTLAGGTADPREVGEGDAADAAVGHVGSPI